MLNLFLTYYLLKFFYLILIRLSFPTLSSPCFTRHLLSYSRVPDSPLNGLQRLANFILYGGVIIIFISYIPHIIKYYFITNRQLFAVFLFVAILTEQFEIIKA